MVWGEWEQLKTAAAERHSTHMELNQLQTPAGGGSGSPAVPGSGQQLKSGRATWTKAGHDVGTLQESVSKALSKLDDGQRGLGGHLGALTAGAQHEVHESWHRYVTDVGKRCDALAGILERTGHAQLKTDDAVRAEIDKLKTRYEDTPDVGGRPAGRR